MKAALALFLAAPPAFAASVQVRAVAAPSIGAVPAALAPLPAASPLLDLPSFPALSAISAGVAPELAVPAPEAAPALSLAQSGVEASPALAAALPTANAVADEGPSSALDGEARAPERPRAQDELSRLSSGRADARAAFDGARGAAPSPGESAAAVAERGAFELEKDADRLFAGLSRIHDLEMREAAPAAELNVQKLAFLRELDAVARALPAVPGPSFADVQRGLADAHSRREEAGRRLEELRRAKDWRALADAGRALAAARREVLAHQLGVARLILLGRSGLRAKALRRNAALWTFAGAVSTAARLAAETRWYERAARMRRVAEGETGALSVSRRRWINAATTLRDAARDARNGRGERARARTAFLASLYEGSTRDAAGPDLPRRYREIAADLRAAERLLETALGANAPPDAVGEASRRLDAAAAALPHPKLSIPETVEFAEPEVAARAQGHTLDSIQMEHAAVAANLAALEAAQGVFSSSLGPGGRVSAEERAAIRAQVDAVRAWSERGFVRPKQRAAQYLRTAISALDRGDWTFAARYLGSAAGALRGRIADLERIAAALRRSPPAS